MLAHVTSNVTESIFFQLDWLSRSLLGCRHSELQILCPDLDLDAAFDTS